VVYFFVAIHAERNKVLFGIITKRASSTDMVDLEIGRAAAMLAPPAIAFQHLPAKFPVEGRIQYKPRPLGP
jgi:hypothetical protein